MIGKAIGAKEVQIGRVRERSIWIEHQQAIRSSRIEHCRQSIAVSIAVISEHARRSDDQLLVFIHYVVVQSRNRTGVGYVNRNSCNVRIRRPIIGVVRK